MERLLIPLLLGTVLACSSAAATPWAQEAADGGDAEAVRDDGGPDAGIVSCYDPKGAKRFTTAPPRAGQDVCGAGTAGEFLAKCVGASANVSDCGAFVKEPANQACLRCLVGPLAGDNPAKVAQPILITLGSAVFLNTGACSMLASSAPSDCAQKAGNEALCILSTCAKCPAGDRLTCTSQSTSTEPCSSAHVPVACESAVKANRHVVDAKCGAVTGASFEDAYAKTVAFVCGPP